MYRSYMFPFYRSPFIGYPAYPFYPGYGPGYYNNNISNIVGSAVANQSMNTIGAGAIGGIQVATPTVVW
jgi:hypothetical protein